MDQTLGCFFDQTCQKDAAKFPAGWRHYGGSWLEDCADQPDHRGRSRIGGARPTIKVAALSLSLAKRSLHDKSYAPPLWGSPRPASAA